MNTNNTSFPNDLSINVDFLVREYKKKDNIWSKLLKEHQYVVNNLLTNDKYFINTKGMLIFHKQGMGKTILSLSVAIGLWNSKKILILAPKALHTNFTDSFIKIATMLHGNDIIKKNKLIRQSIENVTFLSMDAYNVAEKFIKIKDIDNYFVIIDEAHNFIGSVLNSSKRLSNAKRIYNILNKSDSVKMLLLTGSPIVKNPFELVLYANLLNYGNPLPDNYNIFNEYFVGKNEIQNKEKLKNRILGIISFVDADNELFPTVHKAKIIRCSMSPYQYSNYMLKFKKDSTFSDKQLQMGIKIEVVPLSLPKSQVSSYYVGSRTESLYSHIESRVVVDGELKDVEYDIMKINDKFFTRKESNKIFVAADLINKQKGSGIVYSQFIQKGLLVLSRYLDKLGYKRYPQGDDYKTYALYYGDIDHETRSRIIKTFNNESNKNGKHIKVLLLSKIGAEGLDLKNGRWVVQLEPYWHTSRNEQVIARIARLNSHINLPKSERTVQPYLMISSAPKKVSNKTVDEIFFERSMRNHIKVQKFLNLMKCVAVENKDNCIQCAPTDEPLYSNNLANDIAGENPCQPITTEEIDVKKLETGIYYRQYHNMLEIYKYDKTDKLYLPIEENTDEYNNYKKKINKIA